MCEHKFQLFSIAMLGVRWQCVRCDQIAPVCFSPTKEAMSDYESAMQDLFDEHIK